MTQHKFDSYIMDLINFVFEQRTRKHIDYYNLLQKLWNSSRLNKVQLSKYLLSRLIRESSNIISKAQHHIACNNISDEDGKKISFSSFTVH